MSILESKTVKLFWCIAWSFIQSVFLLLLLLKMINERKREKKREGVAIMSFKVHHFLPVDIISSNCSFYISVCGTRSWGKVLDRSGWEAPLGHQYWWKPGGFRQTFSSCMSRPPGHSHRAQGAHLGNKLEQDGAFSVRLTSAFRDEMSCARSLANVLFRIFVLSADLISLELHETLMSAQYLILS